MVLAMMRQEYLGSKAGYNEETLDCVEEHLINAIHHFSEEQKQELKNSVLSNCACFLGQCLIENLGGEWRLPENSNWAIYFDDGNMAFPFAKVWKNYENGSEDSISTMLVAFRALRENGTGVPDWDYSYTIENQSDEIIENNIRIDNFEILKTKLEESFGKKTNVTVNLLTILDERTVTISTEFENENTICLHYDFTKPFEKGGNFIARLDYPLAEESKEFVFKTFENFLKGMMPDRAKFENLNKENETYFSEKENKENDFFQDAVFSYSIYDGDGKYIEESVTIDSFDDVVDKIIYSLNNGYSFSISPDLTINNMLPTMQVVHTTSDKDEPLIMLTFETNPQSDDRIPETYAKFYPCPLSKEDFTDICEFLFAFSMKKLLPNVDSEEWSDLTEYPESNQPEIVTYFSDENGRPFCKDSDGVLYQMYKGNSFDEFAFRYDYETNIYENTLSEISENDAKIKAEYVYNLNGDLYTFWSNGEKVFAVDYNLKVYELIFENDNNFSLSEKLGIDFDGKWESCSIERAQHYLKNGFN